MSIPRATTHGGGGSRLSSAWDDLHIDAPIQQPAAPRAAAAAATDQAVPARAGEGMTLVFLTLDPDSNVWIIGKTSATLSAADFIFV